MKRQIQSYFHCARCVREDRRPNIAVGVISAGTHLQLWCENHDQSLGMFALKEPMPPLACPMCGKSGPHVH
jgi:hypothetical protein